MRLTFALATAAGIVACHKAPQVEPRPARDLGDYAYRMTIQGVPVEGEFSIEADTVLLDADDHSCRRAPTGIIDPLVHPFSCGGGRTSFSVVIDSKRPEQSTWTSSTPVRTTHQTCTRYATTKEGQTICAAMGTEVVVENRRISGRLEVTRIASVDRP
jgi:hypothetical protein